MYYTAKFQDNPPPIRSSSSCSRKSPAVTGHLAWVSCGGHRNGSSRAPWGSSPTSCPWCRFWTLLCRRGKTSWWLRFCTSIRQFPRRLSQCPRFRRHPVVLAWFSVSRRRRNSWWKRQPSCLRCMFSHCAHGARDGGAVGGSADCRVFFLSAAADCRADH